MENEEKEKIKKTKAIPIKSELFNTPNEESPTDKLIATFPIYAAIEHQEKVK